jgi:HlyD family secretion protein
VKSVASLLAETLALPDVTFSEARHLTLSKRNKFFRRISMRRKLIWTAAGVITLLALLSAGFLFAPAVSVTRIATMSLRDEAAGTGFVRAKVSIGVGTKINGILLRTHVDQGDQVEKGQVLAELQSQDVENQILQAESLAEAQRAALSSTRATLGASRARLQAGASGVAKSEAALRLAEISYQRAKSLYERAVASKEALDIAETAYLQAKEDLRNTRALHASAEEQVRAAEAEVAVSEKIVASSEAGVRLQRANLQFTLVRSPVDGYVVTRDLEEGATVVAGQSIFTVAAQSSPIWVSVHIDLREMAGLKVGQCATIALRSMPERAFQGAVSRIAREADPITEEVVVDVAFVGPPPELRLNETAEVHISKRERPAAPALPLTAVEEGPDGPIVWAVRNGRLRPAAVSLGIIDKRGLVEILSGIYRDDEIVVYPKAAETSLTPGKRVRVAHNSKP